MNTSQNKSKRIAINTLLLYMRMIVLMGITLYTSRVVLETLGIEDYGIQNVVGGLVSMFTLLSGSVSASISRFLTYELGHGDKSKLNAIFCTAINLQAAMSLIVFIAIEIVGYWFLNYKMNISECRLEAANWVFQCAMFTFIINLFSIPYHATIVAHEKMNAFAYISILEATLKLGIVYLLYLSCFDKLKTYAVLLLIVALIIRLIYGIYCNRNFEECHYHFIVDKSIIKQMTKFAGWNYLGTAGSLFCGQGLNILINLFFGASVNAARGVATQVEMAVYQFVTNFSTAMNPQIVKSYARGDFDYMYAVVCKGAKFSFFLMLIIVAPLIYECPIILSLWLKEVPDYTIVFVRLTLIYSLIKSLSSTLIIASQATRNIRTYQIIVGGLSIMILPISYLLYRLGMQPESCYYVCIIMELCILISRLPILKKMIGLPIEQYITQVLFRITPVAILSFVSAYSLYCVIPEEFTHLLVFFSLVAIITLFYIYLLGLTKLEKKSIYNIIKK